MNSYKTQYADLHFERAGLFKVIHERYRPRDVLYPGCAYIFPLHLLTNNHQRDAPEAVNDPRLKLKALVPFRKESYSVVEEHSKEIEIPAQKSNDRYLRQAGQRLEYIENETYYVFERLR